MGTEVTTGFGSWLQRQRPYSAAGKLALVLRTELANGRLPRWPSSVREVNSWLRKVQPLPPEWPGLLLGASADWRRWVDGLLTEPPEEAPSGRPGDNSFSN